MVLKEDKEFAISGKPKDSVQEETNAFSGTTVMSVRNQHPKPLHPLSHQHKEVECVEKKRNIRGRSPSGKISRQPCRHNLKGICTKLLCEYWHPPNVWFDCQNRDAKQETSACSRTTRLLNNQVKNRRRALKTEKSDDQGAVAIVKTVPQLGYVSQDSEPSGLPKSEKYWGDPRGKVLGSIRRVRFTQSYATSSKYPRK